SALAQNSFVENVRQLVDAKPAPAAADSASLAAPAQRLLRTSVDLLEAMAEVVAALPSPANTDHLADLIHRGETALAAIREMIAPKLPNANGDLVPEPGPAKMDH